MKLNFMYRHFNQIFIQLISNKIMTNFMIMSDWLYRFFFFYVIHTFQFHLFLNIDVSIYIFFLSLFFMASLWKKSETEEIKNWFEYFQKKYIFVRSRKVQGFWLDSTFYWFHSFLIFMLDWMQRIEFWFTLLSLVDLIDKFMLKEKPLNF